MKLGATDVSNGPLVEPSSVLAYLRAPDWVRLEQHTHRGRPVAMLFEHPRRDVEVHVPLWLEARDYAPQLAQVLNAIAAVEGRSPLSLLLELRAAHADVVQISTHEALSLPRSIALLTAVQELLLLCAPPPSSRAAALLQGVTLAPVDQASEQTGTVCVRVPVAESQRSELDTAWHVSDAGPRSFGRQVTERLAVSVAAVQRAAAEAVRTGSFAASDTSTALYRALAAIGVPFSIELAWALTMPRTPVPAVSFTAEQLAALAAAAALTPRA